MMTEAFSTETTALRIRPTVSPLKNARLFLADDSLDSLFLFRQALKPEGCRFQWATDGFEALEKLRQLPQVQMILMDYYMPGLNAEQVLVELEKSIETDPVASQIWGSSRKPVILFSAAKLSAFHWPTFQRFQIVDLWQKPLFPNKIRESLARTLHDWNHPENKKIRDLLSVQN